MAHEPDISLKQQIRLQADALYADFWAAAKEAASPERQRIVQVACETLITAAVLGLIETDPRKQSEYAIAADNATESLSQLKVAGRMDGATLMNNVMRKRIREGLTIAMKLASLAIKP